MQIATDQHYAGAKSLQMSLFPSTVEVGLSVVKLLNPALDTLYCRAYMKWDAGYNVVGSNHNGINMRGGVNPMTGQPPPADGTGFFVFLLQHAMINTSDVPPGHTELYSYWPKQRDQWGDHWYPTGYVVPPGADGNNGDWLTSPAQYPNFKPLPNFTPQRDKWYCFEMMTHINTVGKSDGEVKVWIDGKVAADFTDLFIRGIDSLIHYGSKRQASFRHRTHLR